MGKPTGQMQQETQETLDEYNAETGEYETTEPRTTYYGGDDEAPILSKNFDEFTRIDCWQEYSYVFVKDRWVGYSVRHKWNDDYSKMTDCIVEEVEIPKKRQLNKCHKGVSNPLF